MSAQHRILPYGTVHTMLATADARDAVAKAVAAAQPNLTFTDNFRSGIAAVKYFENAKGTVPATARGFEFECLITDTPCECDGGVMYALHEKKIPVLRICSVANATKTDDDEETLTHPLLENVNTAADSNSISESVARYLAFPAESKRGRVIVIEGGDGAGKQTQTGLLLEKLRSLGRKAVTIDFPNDAARYGVLIREILAGHKGPLKEVSPLVFGTLYGLNRHDLKPWIDNWLLRGTHIVFDRWTTANYGHQASKFKSDEERDAAIAALRTFEVKWLGLPDADRVIYLDLPPAVAYAAMLADVSRKELDLHEKAGIEYKENVRRAFLWCCERFAESWSAVPCWDEKEEKRISKPAVHAAIWALCKPSFE